MNAQSQTNSHNSNWELLGQLELSRSSAQNNAIHEWLDRMLEPLKLYEDICRRVEVSLQEAAARVLDIHPEIKTRHVHLKLYLPAERRPTGQNWSFFRVEKIQDQANDERISDHSIELYLYLEAH